MHPKTQPRSRGGPQFKPKLYPKCDGGPAPPLDDPAPNAQRKLKLLAAYYEINVCYRRLLAIRRSGRRFRVRVRPAIRALENAFAARERLEHQYAVYGFASAPRVRRGLIINVVFTVPPPRQPQPSSVSLCFAVTP
jgi:hypothetical protein